MSSWTIGGKSLTQRAYPYQPVHSAIGIMLACAANEAYNLRADVRMGDETLYCEPFD
jgi:hypothetical protein